MQIKIALILSLFLPSTVLAEKKEQWWFANVGDGKKSCRPAPVSMYEMTASWDKDNEEYQFGEDTERFGYYSISVQSKKEPEIVYLSVWAKSLEKCSDGLLIARMNLAAFQQFQSRNSADIKKKMGRDKAIEDLRQIYNKKFETDVNLESFKVNIEKWNKLLGSH